MARLTDPPYLAFPFRIEKTGAKRSSRSEHVREQIEQVLFTYPGERVFRPEFGSGVRALVFEPNNPALQKLTRQRLIASLAPAVEGEVDPKTLEVNVELDEEKLRIFISYLLATIGQAEQHEFEVNAGGGENG